LLREEGEERHKGEKKGWRLKAGGKKKKGTTHSVLRKQIGKA